MGAPSLLDQLLALCARHPKAAFVSSCAAVAITVVIVLTLAPIIASAP